VLVHRQSTTQVKQVLLALADGYLALSAWPNASHSQTLILYWAARITNTVVKENHIRGWVYPIPTQTVQHFINQLRANNRAPQPQSLLCHSLEPTVGFKHLWESSFGCHFVQDSQVTIPISGSYIRDWLHLASKSNSVCHSPVKSTTKFHNREAGHHLRHNQERHGLGQTTVNIVNMLLDS